jgi:hypothetical protein
MDGDVAPLAELATLAGKHGAALLVDEAHALGVLGPGGRGLCHEAGVRPDILVGTLGKAFGAAGGFAAGSATLRKYLVNRSRTFIFTTAPPPPLAAAALAALHIIRGDEGQARRNALVDRVLQLRMRLTSKAPLLPRSPISRSSWEWIARPLTHLAPYEPTASSCSQSAPQPSPKAPPASVSPSLPVIGPKTLTPSPKHSPPLSPNDL